MKCTMAITWRMKPYRSRGKKMPMGRVHCSGP
jgi:hypothetical protein